MTLNSDITIYNFRLGPDRRELLYPTQIQGVSWYCTHDQMVSDKVRTGKTNCTIRIPMSADVESGRIYVSKDVYKALTADEAKGFWTIQNGAYLVQGLCGDGESAGITATELQKNHRDYIVVTEYADNTIRGTDARKHWRIGGA